MARKHPPADRDLRLTNLEGKPVTVNFNFVALREPAAVFPHTFITMFDVALGKHARLDGSDKEHQWVVSGKLLDNAGSVAFNRQSLSGTRLTVATGSESQLLEVVQTPEQIERALRNSSHDLHAQGLQKWVAFETKEKSRLGTAIRKLER